METKKIEEFLRKQEIDFKDISHYIKALSHMSWINEHNLTIEDSYERLEFLGDAVIQRAVSRYLYDYSHRTPGEMTLLRSKIVKKESLANIGREIGLDKIILIGKGEDRNKLSDSVIEDSMEALVGAIEEDLGPTVSEKFVNDNISWRVGRVDLDEMKDFKTRLQELLQAEKRSNVVYETITTDKTDKEGRQIFKAIVTFDGVTLGEGEGVSKKKAETAAAEQAYNKMVK